MSWCEVREYCDFYERDLNAVKRLDNKYGAGIPLYQLVYSRLKQLCNHNHLKCEKLKELLQTKL